LKSSNTALKDVLIFEPESFRDQRGYFYEIYNRSKYPFLEQGIEFVQDNISFSVKNTLRGLHFQKSKPQGKLVTCLQGEVRDVLVDLRISSNTFGEHLIISLSQANKKQIWIPPGFAHGFHVISDAALFYYKCTDFYDPSDEYGIIWNDLNLDINWGVNNPIISEKDSYLPSFSTVVENLI